MSKVQQGDFYDVLRVRPDATQKEIARGYRTQIQRLGDEKHEQQSFLDDLPRPERIAQIQEAYDTLSDKEKRAAYDRALGGETAPLTSLTPYSGKKTGAARPSPLKGKGRKRQNIYEDFFGFSEKPFDLTPDPKYLYLSPTHKEVMAHLVFGLQENTGFIKIIGEVGTGKTMISRSFLSQLHADFNVAYIFNPCLNSLELLQTINAELGVRSDSDSRKELTDILNRFLLEERKRGHRVVVIIDEAQDLDPRVLEQLRLLSNLETTTEKLIQIVLIGQPELDRLLARDELRQLRQRITINWELRPLNREESRRYIEHRLNVAMGKGKVKFTRPATDLIFRYSQGIPRMINVLADRALLIAYTMNTKKIGVRVIRLAADDAGGFSLATPPWQMLWKVALPVAAVAGLLVYMLNDVSIPDFGAAPAGGRDIKQFIRENPLDVSDPGGLIPAKDAGVAVPETVAETPPSPPAAPSAVPPPAVTPSSVATPSPSTVADGGSLEISQSDKLVTYLSSLSLMESKVEAVKWVLESWGLVSGNLVGLDESVFENLASDYQLLQYEMTGNFQGLSAFNYPAILEITLPNAQGTKYLALISIKGDRGVFGSVDRIEMPLSTLEPLWNRKAIILWRDFENLPPLIRRGYRGKEVLWLQKNLRQLGFFKGREAPVFGPKTRQAVIRFQRHNGIKDDGNFHVESKVMLYNLLSIYPTPKLAGG
ncbi:MAG: AAA family ATPase [Nitrospinales bacterium]